MHQDLLSALNEPLAFNQKLYHIHSVICGHLPFVERIAIALYEPETDLLKTFVASDAARPRLEHYSAPLAEAKSLLAVKEHRQPRVINDLSIFDHNGKKHTRTLRQSGYRSSYTLPMLDNGQFKGFVFFNAKEKGAFDKGVLDTLDVFGHLITLSALKEVGTLSNVVNTIALIRELTRYRDQETGAHLERMAQYAKIIARELADRYQLSDQYIEYVFQAAPLHDIGKIGIPDQVLLKPGPLTADERAIMRSHVRKGREMVDFMADTYGLDGLAYVDVLRNVAEFHHEAVDGSGYLAGLKDGEIPLEARIVAVADVFDALTSERPYKDAWSNARALAMMSRLAEIQFDRDCVEALAAHPREIAAIQDRFSDEPAP